MSGPIRKAVIPVAGLGTRLFPATKAIPKEMLTVFDRPAIQFIVDEAREAGIEQFVFVTGRNKSSIEDYFDRNFELEAALREQGNQQFLDQLPQTTLGPGRASFTRQHFPLGLGHAIGCAHEIIGDEPFAVLLPDMIMRSNPGCLVQMVSIYERRGGGNVIALEEVERSEVSRYGVAGFQRTADGGMLVDKMVEKPTLERAPSNHIIAGRYILQPRIFELIAALKPGAGSEIQLTDAMTQLLTEQTFWGFEFEGETFDCGDKLGLLLANVAHGLADESIGPAFRAALIKQISREHAVARRPHASIPELIAV